MTLSDARDFGITKKVFGLRSQVMGLWNRNMLLSHSGMLTTGRYTVLFLVDSGPTVDRSLARTRKRIQDRASCSESSRGPPISGWAQTIVVGFTDTPGRFVVPTLLPVE